MDPSELLAGALLALAGPGEPPFERSTAVPARPGLYALHAAPAVWDELGLGVPPDPRPLYVGKSESSLVGRDVRAMVSAAPAAMAERLRSAGQAISGGTA